MDQIKVFKVQYDDSWGEVEREKPEKEEKEEEERSGRKVGPGLNAGSSAPVTTASSSTPRSTVPSSALVVIDRAQELSARDASV